MSATFLDQNGKEAPFIMGCYGIGVGRTAMAAIEQHYDDNGPLWPISIAPFEVILLPANMKDENISEFAHSLYSNLLSKNVDVLFDDRPERLGVKFADADLIGAPIRIVIGKQIAEGFIEINFRNGEKKSVSKADVVSLVVNSE